MMPDFVTLTYDNEHLPPNCSLRFEHLALFWKRLRKRVPNIKYFASGEYGETTLRPHYHAIIFGLTEANRRDVYESWKMCDINRFVHGKCYEPVTREAIQYVASYIKDAKLGIARQDYLDAGLEPPALRVSQNIGFRYFIENREKILKQGGVRFDGVLYGVPRTVLRMWKEEPKGSIVSFLDRVEQGQKESQAQFLRELDGSPFASSQLERDKFWRTYEARKTTLQELNKSKNGVKKARGGL